MKIIFGINAENFMKIKQGMTSGECVENKWFNMKYIGNYLSVEILFNKSCYMIENCDVENLCLCLNHKCL
jgi:hypothetical protein